MIKGNAAVIQMTSGGDYRANLVQAEDLLKRAADAGAALALLPENFALMGQRESDKVDLAEADGTGPIQDFLARMAQRLGLWIVGGTLPIRVPGEAARVYASCGVWNAQGARVARYDKVHLFDVAVPDADAEHYRESASIAPGAVRAVVVDSPIGRLGLSVCYDLRFAELYRALAAQGAEVLCVPSAFTARTGQAHWRLLLRARAVENLCHVLAANQCGYHDNGRQTWGHSLIVEPWGDVLADAGAHMGIACAEIDLLRQRALREHFPVLTHRRFD
ncbi:carbon-nitrogen hydrolase family protein [Sinimarinibacterium sp. NLF-5-8]|uniref:carbon-nitrogen hydrolase family protein n=1 Tax=Sinimarinibacterium sp. NLF-5-8 TaxID=2698684 RepID=UPI00137C0A29|nr:carbon-nitrogen hydrolase family protein [Sinimarinibacterium sp. NLF-5-8]QHS10015.1 carbon-nitrogen hydrolase family protein [Sinimarinibacterium sp. NLF-5-8]